MSAKRTFDVILTLLILVVGAPIIVMIFVLSRALLGTPVLFRQDRPGLHGKMFTLVKFRTMKVVSADDGSELSDEDRMTGFGGFLRKTSLDELPGLWNVLKGDMSLVGPRPLLPEYVPLYSARQARRHEVRPGVTGWAQINGRNAIGWDEKFGLDVWYVDNQSLWLDIKILALTVVKVCNRQGISADGQATMPKFTGNKS